MIKFEISKDEICELYVGGTMNDILNEIVALCTSVWWGLNEEDPKEGDAFKRILDRIGEKHGLIKPEMMSDERPDGTIN